MKRSVVLLLITLSFPSIASSEIYRWRDANGKWHFSDNAPGKVEADRVDLPKTNRADAVEIKRRPGAVPQSTHSDGHSANLEQRSMCVQAQEQYIRLTRGIDHTATSKRLVIVRDGSPISRREQNQYAEKMRANYNAKGCNIAQADNLRL